MLLHMHHHNAAADARRTRVHSRDGSTFLRENDVITVALKYDVISEIRLVNRLESSVFTRRLRHTARDNYCLLSSEFVAYSV